MIRNLLTATALVLAGATAMAASTIDLNSATAAELAEMLDGVGEVRAQAIVDHRTENGDFASVGGVLAVDGIGEATLEANRDRMVVGTE